MVKPLMQIQLSGVKKNEVVPQDAEHKVGDPVADVSNVVTLLPSAVIRPLSMSTCLNVMSDARKHP